MVFRCKPALKTECRNCSPQRKVNVVLFRGPSPILSSPLGCKVDGPDSERRMEYESEHVVQAEHVNDDAKKSESARLSQPKSETALFLQGLVSAF